MTVKYFNVKNGLTAGSITLDADTGNTTTTNLSVTGESNLGSISNVIITGGTNGYVLSTDGTGNLSFVDPTGTSTPAPMPITIDVGNTLTIAANYQGLFGVPLDIEGTLVVEGVLYDVNAPQSSGGGNGTPGGSNTQVQFNDSSSFGGNSGFTFNKTTGIFTAPYLAGNGNGLSNIQGANVSGQVSSANVANAANAVFVGNVVGLGNIATINKDGNSSNVLYGNGFFSAAPVTYSDSNVVTLLSSFGSNTITTTGNVSVGNITATNLGNLSSINKDGNASNILYGNGVFATAPSGGGYSDSNVVTLLSSFGSNTITTTGNVSVGNIIGNGQSLTGIAGANVTGAVSYATTANSVAGANVSGEVSYAATANAVAGANVSGQVGNALVAGTVYTAAQPNITSTGTLTSLSVSGNANIGNVGTAGLITATGNINAGNVITGGIVSATGGATFAGNIAMTSKNITGLADPVDLQDAATKNYVDSVAQGLHVHDSCYVATTGTLATASGGSTSYNNGSSGVGATITTTGTFLLIDGANVQTAGTRILVKNEANGAWNGVYTYTNTTTLTRATDYDTTTEAAGGDFLFVTSGSTQADSGWVQTTDNPVIGTSDIVFNQFSGAGTYTAGTGLTLTGTTFSVNASQTQITAVGTLTSLSVSGNANIGNVGATTFVGNINGGTGNSNVGNLGVTGVYSTILSATGNANVGNIGATLFVGTLATGAQPNITSTGTLTSLSVSGNANIGNIGTGGLITATGNINAGNIITGGIVSATGNVTGSYILGNGSQLSGVATAARALGYSLVFGG